MEKPPIRTNTSNMTAAAARWYESVPGGPAEELAEVVEILRYHEIESDSS